MAAVLIASAARTRLTTVAAAMPAPVVASSLRLEIIMMSLSLSPLSVGGDPMWPPRGGHAGPPLAIFLVVPGLLHRLVPDVVRPGALRLLADHGIGAAGEQDLHGPLIGGLVEIAGALVGLADQLGDLAHHALLVLLGLRPGLVVVEHDHGGVVGMGDRP